MWNELMWNRVTTIAMSVVVLIAMVMGGIWIYKKLTKKIQNGDIKVSNFNKVSQAIHAYKFSFAASIVLNVDGKIIGANKRAQKIFGWKEEELMGNKMDKILPPEAVAKFEAHKKDHSIINEDDEILEIELDAITRLEEKKVLRTKIGRWTDDLDIYFIISMLDITHRKRNEEAIKAAEAEINHIRRVYHEGEKVGHVGFWIMDCQTGKLQYSSNFATMYSTSKQGDVYIEHLIKRVSPDDRVRVVETMRKAKENKTGYDMEYKFLNLDGYINTIHSTVSAVKNKAGDLTHFVGMARLIKKEKPQWL